MDGFPVDVDGFLVEVMLTDKEFGRVKLVGVGRRRTDIQGLSLAIRVRNALYSSNRQGRYRVLTGSCSTAGGGDLASGPRNAPLRTSNFRVMCVSTWRLRFETDNQSSEGERGSDQTSKMDCKHSYDAAVFCGGREPVAAEHHGSIEIVHAGQSSDGLVAFYTGVCSRAPWGAFALTSCSRTVSGTQVLGAGGPKDVVAKSRMDSARIVRRVMRDSDSSEVWAWHRWDGELAGGVVRRRTP